MKSLIAEGIYTYVEDGILYYELSPVLKYDLAAWSDHTVEQLKALPAGEPFFVLYDLSSAMMRGLFSDGGYLDGSVGLTKAGREEVARLQAEQSRPIFFAYVVPLTMSGRVTHLMIRRETINHAAARRKIAVMPFFSITGAKEWIKSLRESDPAV